MNNKRMQSAVLLLVCALLLSACQAMEVQQDAVHQPPVAPPSAPAGHGEPMPQAHHAGIVGRVLDIRNIPSLDDMLPELSRQRVVFVGESHTSYGHHLSQLEIIQRLHEMDIDFAIGMEFFQQPYQAHLDAYIAGTQDEKEMLLKTEYWDRWSFDYRLYRPILNYAREHGIPLVALNLPKEITRKVADQGMEALSEEEKAQVPAEIDDSDEVYRQRMKAIFEQHPHKEAQEFSRFLQVQLLWDEGMAARAADYLTEHPQRRMVVLSGSGHLLHGAGIPRRLERRIPMESAIVLPCDDMAIEPGMSDFLIFPPQLQLPPKGMMGVLLGDEQQGVLITGVIPGSAASQADLRKDDVIVSLQGRPMPSVAALKIELLEAKPGDKVNVVLRRKALLFGDKEFQMELVLGQ